MGTDWGTMGHSLTSVQTHINKHTSTTCAHTILLRRYGDQSLCPAKPDGDDTKKKCAEPQIKKDAHPMERTLTTTVMFYQVVRMRSKSK